MRVALTIAMVPMPDFAQLTSQTSFNLQKLPNANKLG